MSLYPLKSFSRRVGNMWAGQKIEKRARQGMPPGKPIGESWEYYFPPGVVEGSTRFRVAPRSRQQPLAGARVCTQSSTLSSGLMGDVPLVGREGHGGRGAFFRS